MGLDYLMHGDLTPKFAHTIERYGLFACDIETTGLDWKSDQIGTIQVFVSDDKYAILRPSQQNPTRFLALLANAKVKKIFHHAMFDLRFLCNRWSFSPSNVSCTKVAAKLLSRVKREQSLVYLIEHYLNIQLDKGMQKSDWLTSQLSKEQIRYAIADVRYLENLLLILREELRSTGKIELADACFDYIPTKVRLELDGYLDIFEY